MGRPPTSDTTEYGQRTGGTHPTGIHSCFAYEIILLQRREVQLKKALDKLKDQREIVKKERRRREIPTVAVVGYTNSGITSLSDYA